MGNSGPTKFKLSVFQEVVEGKDMTQIKEHLDILDFELENAFNETSEIYRFQKDVIGTILNIMRDPNVQTVPEILELCFKTLQILIDDRTKVNIFFNLKGVPPVCQFITKNKGKTIRNKLPTATGAKKEEQAPNFTIAALRFLNQIVIYVRDDQAQQLLASGIVHSIILLIVETRKHSVETHQLASRMLGEITSVDSTDVLKILKDAMVTQHISFLLNEELDDQTILNLLRAIANLSKHIHVLAQANVLDGALFAIKNIFLQSQLSSQLAEAARFIANLAISADTQIFKRLEIINPVNILLDIVRQSQKFDEHCVNQSRMALLQLCRRNDFQTQIQDQEGVRILRKFEVPKDPPVDKVAQIAELVCLFARGQSYLRFCEILDFFITPLLLVTIPPNFRSSRQDIELFKQTEDVTKFFALEALAHLTLYQRFQLKLFFRPFLKAIARSLDAPKQGGIESIRHSLNILGNLMLHPLNRASLVTQAFEQIAEQIVEQVLRLNKQFDFQKGVDISIDCELILVLMCFKSNLEMNTDTIVNFLLRTISARNSRIHLTKALGGLANLISYDRNIRKTVLHKHIIRQIQEIVDMCLQKQDFDLADSPIVKELSNLIVELTHAPFNTELWLRFQSANVAVDSSNNRFPLIVGKPLHVKNIFEQDKQKFHSDGSVLFNFGDYLILKQMPDTTSKECAICAWFQLPVLDTGNAHTLLQNCKGFGGLAVIDKDGKRMYCYDEVSGKPVDCGINLRNLSAGWHHVVINVYNQELQVRVTTVTRFKYFQTGN